MTQGKTPVNLPLSLQRSLTEAEGVKNITTGDYNKGWTHISGIALESYLKGVGISYSLAPSIVKTFEFWA